MKRAISAVLAAALALPLFAESPRWPFIVIRHTSAINARPDVFAQLVDCHRRHPGVCDEFWFAKTILSVAKPDSYWLDDDLRLGVKKQDGCFCPRCIEAFNAKTRRRLPPAVVSPGRKS